MTCDSYWHAIYNTVFIIDSTWLIPWSALTLFLSMGFNNGVHVHSKEAISSMELVFNH